MEQCLEHLDLFRRYVHRIHIFKRVHLVHHRGNVRIFCQFGKFIIEPDGIEHIQKLVNLFPLGRRAVFTDILQDVFNAGTFSAGQRADGNLFFFKEFQCLPELHHTGQHGQHFSG